MITRIWKNNSFHNQHLNLGRQGRYVPFTSIIVMISKKSKGFQKKYMQFCGVTNSNGVHWKCKKPPIFIGGMQFRWGRETLVSSSSANVESLFYIHEAFGISNIINKELISVLSSGRASERTLVLIDEKVNELLKRSGWLM